jgi:hypothetical protein
MSKQLIALAFSRLLNVLFGGLLLRFARAH